MSMAPAQAGFLILIRKSARILTKISCVMAPPGHDAAGKLLAIGNLGNRCATPCPVEIPARQLFSTVHLQLLAPRTQEKHGYVLPKLRHGAESSPKWNPAQAISESGKVHAVLCPLCLPLPYGHDIQEGPINQPEVRDKIEHLGKAAQEWLEVATLYGTPDKAI